MPLNIAINGFGRIGRTAFKIAFQKPSLKIVAINDLGEIKTLAHLLKYDSVYGIYEKEVSYSQNRLIVDNKKILVLSQKDPLNLPWKKLKIDVVLECTGRLTSKELAEKHLKSGSKYVIISAPAQGNNVPTIILGVNDKQRIKEPIISAASCTTNCIIPVMKVLKDAFGVKKAIMTTIHAYTADQNLVDGAHQDLRRARSAATNIIPTTTGAALDTTRVLPELKGLFDGLAFRVPVAIGSLSDVTVLVKKPVTVEKINEVFKKASKNSSYKNILTVTKEPLVSSDIIKNPASTIVDLSLTKVIDGDLVKVIAWYDNEWGYTNRLVELAMRLV